MLVRFKLFPLVTLCLVVASLALGDVEVGATRDEVVAELGEPQIKKDKNGIEQWFYGEGKRILFKNGKVTSLKIPTEAKPISKGKSMGLAGTKKREVPKASGWKADPKIIERLSLLPPEKIESAFYEIVPKGEESKYANTIAYFLVSAGEKLESAGEFIKIAMVETEGPPNNNRLVAIGNAMQLCEHRGEKGLFIRYGETAVQQFEKIKKLHPVTAFGILKDLSAAYYEAEQFKQAARIAKKMVSLAREYNTAEEEANGFRKLGEAELRLKNHNEALSAADAAANIYSRLGDENGMAISEKLAGNAYIDQDLPIKALGHYQKSLALYKRVGDNYGIANANFNMGIAERHRENYSKAIRYFNESVEYFQKERSHVGLGMTLVELGQLYEGIGDSAKADASFQQARLFLTQARSIRRLAILESHVGAIEIKRGNPENARKAYQQAMDLYNQLGDKSAAAEIAADLKFLN